jgi:transaldolase
LDAAKVAEELRKAEAELESLVNTPNTSEAGPDPNAIPAAQQRITDLKIQQRQAREKTALEEAEKGSLPKLFPGGLKQFQAMVDTNPDAFGPKGQQLKADLYQASPEYRKAEKREAQTAEDRATISGDVKAEDKEKSAAEDAELAEGRDRIAQAQKRLAWQLEHDPYATGEVAAAEEKFRKAMEAQAAIQDKVGAQRADRTDTLANSMPFPRCRSG